MIHRHTRVQATRRVRTTNIPFRYSVYPLGLPVPPQPLPACTPLFPLCTCHRLAVRRPTARHAIPLRSKTRRILLPFECTRAAMLATVRTCNSDSTHHGGTCSSRSVSSRRSRTVDDLSSSAIASPSSSSLVLFLYVFSVFLSFRLW